MTLQRNCLCLRLFLIFLRQLVYLQRHHGRFYQKEILYHWRTENELGTVPLWHQAEGL